MFLVIIIIIVQIKVKFLSNNKSNKKLINPKENNLSKKHEIKSQMNFKSFRSFDNDIHHEYMKRINDFNFMNNSNNNQIDIFHHYIPAKASKNLRKLVLKDNEADNLCQNIEKIIFNSIYDNERIFDSFSSINNFNQTLNSHFENYLLLLKERTKTEKIKFLYAGNHNIEQNVFFRNFKSFISNEQTNNNILFHNLFDNIAFEDNFYFFGKNKIDIKPDDIILKFYVAHENQGDSIPETSTTTRTDESYLKINTNGTELFFKLNAFYFQFSSIPIFEKNENINGFSTFPAQLTLVLNEKISDKRLLVNINFSQNNYDLKLDENQGQNILNQEPESYKIDKELIKLLKKDIKNVILSNITSYDGIKEKNIPLALFNNKNFINLENLNKRVLNLKKLILYRFNYTENIGDNFINSLQNAINFINNKRSNKETNKKTSLNETLDFGIDFSIINSILQNPKSNFEASVISAINENKDSCDLYFQIDLIENIPLSSIRLKKFKNFINNILKYKMPETKKYFSRILYSNINFNKENQNLKEYSNLKNSIKLSNKLEEDKTFLEKTSKIENSLFKKNVKLKEKEKNINNDLKSFVDGNIIFNLLSENQLQKTSLDLNKSLEYQFIPLNFNLFNKPLNEEMKEFENEILIFEDSFDYLFALNKITNKFSKNSDIIKLIDNFLFLITNNSKSITKGLLNRNSLRQGDFNDDYDDFEEDDSEIIYRDDAVNGTNSQSQEKPHPKKHKKKHKKKKHHKHNNNSTKISNIERLNFEELLEFLKYIKISPIINTLRKNTSELNKNNIKKIQKNSNSINILKDDDRIEKDNEEYCKKYFNKSKINKTSNIYNENSTKHLDSNLNESQLNATESKVTFKNENNSKNILKSLNETDKNNEESKKSFLIDSKNPNHTHYLVLISDEQSQEQNTKETPKKKDNNGNSLNINVNIIKTKEKKKEKEKEEIKNYINTEKLEKFSNNDGGENVLKNSIFEIDEFVKNKEIKSNVKEKVNRSPSSVIPKISRKQNLKIKGDDVIFDEIIIFGETN